MVKSLRPDVRLRILEMERVDDAAREIHRSHNGLFVKRRRERGKAQQEFDATQLARFLLPAELEVCRSWGVIGDEYFVSEALEQKSTWRNDEHVGWAIDYLVGLHRVAIDPQTQRDLIDAGFDHYLGATLRRRLAHELEYAHKAFGRVAGLEGEVVRFGELVATALGRWNFDDDRVLGHGDFQKSNLYVRAGKIVPIDWTDFGVCDRAYEVMHFSKSLPLERRSEMLGRYAAGTGADAAALAIRGGVVDAIVRAGGAARLARNQGQDFETWGQHFAEQVARGFEALSSD